MEEKKKNQGPMESREVSQIWIIAWEFLSDTRIPKKEIIITDT